jgi:hypothetical protein
MRVRCRMAAGTETLEGRTAEVYAVDSSGSDGGVLGGLEIPIRMARGTVWVDGETGALLKAALDYQADVKDTSGSLQGSGPGHLDIVVTQVGRVSVALPVQ